MQRNITLKFYFHPAAQPPAEKAERIRQKPVKLQQLAGEGSKAFWHRKEIWAVT